MWAMCVFFSLILVYIYFFFFRVSLNSRLEEGQKEMRTNEKENRTFN